MEHKTNEIVSTRRLALKWWNDESNLLNRTALFNRYFSNTATKDKMFTVANNYEELTGREIEEIYNKEVLEPKRQKEWQESQVNCKYTKPNAKEFKQFDESLHKAYLNKFSEEDKFKAFISNLNELSKEIQFNAFLTTLKKMNLDSQTQSNIMTLVALRDI